MRVVPHLNELQEKYEGEGLTVVGVSNEAEALMRGKIKSAKMKFPVARVEGLNVDRAYQVAGVPRTFLIDKQGKLVWYGHPAELVEEQIAALLK